MTIRTATRPQGGGAADRSAALRDVMDILSEKGFAKTSIANLRNAADQRYAVLHKAFGTREDILRAAIQSCAETEASLAHETLRVSPTGREAVLAMLEEECAAAPALATILWLSFHLQHLYRSGRRD